MRRVRRPRPVATLALIGLIGSACVAPGPAPSEALLRSAASSGIPLVTPARPTPSAATTSPTAAADPTPIVDLAPADVDASTFTVICESWGEEVPSDEVPCGLAIELAMSALGEAGTVRTARVDVRYGERCVIVGACERRADVRSVIAISPQFDTLIVQVAREGTDILVWPPVAGPRVPPAAFAAPRSRAPDVGAGAPIDLLDRESVPFCGREIVDTPDAYDTAARRCFVAGIKAWTPVELISAETTEDGVITRVYRYQGAGPIRQFVRTPSGWTSLACGISPIDTIAVFVVTECRRTDPS